MKFSLSFLLGHSSFLLPEDSNGLGREDRARIFPLFPRGGACDTLSGELIRLDLDGKIKDKSKEQTAWAE